MKTVMTITGIRPDFIRMAEIFKQLDKKFHHILVHTGQHFDKMLSDVFFEELDIRRPDYNLSIGAYGKRHHQQLADLSVSIIDLIERENLHPDVILFLGDSNSVVAAVPLKKEGFKIGHIEAGMRSYDRRMLEEINRVVCDHCSDFLFVYHPDYRDNCLREGISDDKIFVVGNTIVEVCKQHITTGKKRNDQIILDIHRPENFKYPERLKNIVHLANRAAREFGVPVRMLRFSRTEVQIDKFGIKLGDIEPVSLMSYKQYLNTSFHSLCLISDSGTAQEEPALLGTPVIVPRDFTERPQSVSSKCSYMVDVNTQNESWSSSIDFVKKREPMDTQWLGDGNTARSITEILARELNCGS